MITITEKPKIDSYITPITRVQYKRHLTESQIVHNVSKTTKRWPKILNPMIKKMFHRTLTSIVKIKATDIKITMIIQNSNNDFVSLDM